MHTVHMNPQRSFCLHAAHDQELPVGFPVCAILKPSVQANTEQNPLKNRHGSGKGTTLGVTGMAKETFQLISYFNQSKYEHEE